MNKQTKCLIRACVGTEGKIEGSEESWNAMLLSVKKRKTQMNQCCQRGESQNQSMSMNFKQTWTELNP
jgi:hypothetical protein